MPVVGEDARERVAVGRVAPAGRDQRAGRIGRHELDEDPHARVGTAGAEPLAGLEHGAQRIAVPAVRQRQVEESRAGDLIRGQRVAQQPGQRLPHALGDLPRSRVQVRSQQHADVGRVVALAGPLGALDANSRPDPAARRPWCAAAPLTAARRSSSGVPTSPGELTRSRP